MFKTVFWYFLKNRFIYRSKAPLPSNYSQSMPPPSVTSSDTTENSIENVANKFGSMSVAPALSGPSSAQKPPSISTDEKLRILKDMIRAEPNGIRAKLLLEKFIQAHGQNRETHYLSEFETFIHRKLGALSAEIDDSGMIRHIGYSANHFINIFDKASSISCLESRNLTSKYSCSLAFH